MQSLKLIYASLQRAIDQDKDTARYELAYSMMLLAMLIHSVYPREVKSKINGEDLDLHEVLTHIYVTVAAVRLVDVTNYESFGDEITQALDEVTQLAAETGVVLDATYHRG